MRLLSLLSLLAASAVYGAQFQITIDTTPLNLETGTIDISFNPGSFPASYEAGTAVITGFSLGSGSLGSIAAGPDGGASGTLPGPLTIQNSDFLNGIVYNATFSTSATFFVDFSGAAFTNSGQSILSSLAVQLIGSGVIVAQADLIGDGQIDSSFSSEGVTVTPAAAGVPEPGTFVLMGLGLGAAALVRRRAGAR